jgi:hypothetical protein
MELLKLAVGFYPTMGFLVAVDKSERECKYIF